MRTGSNIYKEIMRSKVLGALETARTISGVSHQVLKGRIREILTGDLFRPLLPSDVSIASGQIVECDSGRLSRQQDIILFDGSILPPMQFDPSAAIIPIESVLYTIEIKSELTKGELRKAHDNAKELAEFSYLKGIRYENGKKILDHVGQLISVTFAINSNLKGPCIDEVKRYRKIYGDEAPYLKAICVAGRGYWYESNGSWLGVSGNNDGEDVLAFIGGVMNTYKGLSKTRGIQAIGHYLIETPESFETFPSGTRPTIHVYCEGCGKKAVCFFKRDRADSKEWPEGFISPDPCHGCGGRLIAPAGKYFLRNGLYERDS